ncbi:hypothetical protein EON71_00075 [bacterium]|nr:MAG: hypothetical protein EON71_00075 [bacterium]
MLVYFFFNYISFITSIEIIYICDIYIYICVILFFYTIYLAKYCIKNIPIKFIYLYLYIYIYLYIIYI